jgi:hypothetical protein
MKQFVGALIMSIAALGQMSVADACENWLESRKYHLAPRTFEGYSHHIKTFSPFFSGLLIPIWTEIISGAISTNAPNKLPRTPSIKNSA